MIHGKWKTSLRSIILSLLLAVTAIAGGIGLPMFEVDAEAAADVWNGEYPDDADEYMQNSDNMNWDEYVFSIESAEDLAAFAKYINEVDPCLSAVLENDIDLNGKEWIPIGGEQTDTGCCFCAEYFDGQGHTISGLSITDDTEYNTVGFFGLIGCEIKNLIVQGEITGSAKYAGGIAGKSWDGSVSNCRNEVNITSSHRSPSLGGIVGYAEDCGITISYCSNYGNISSTSGSESAGVGGMVGKTSDNTTISYCYNQGDLSGMRYAGGMLGYTEANKVTLKICYNAGNITCKTNSEIFGAICGNVNYATVSGTNLFMYSGNGISKAEGNSNITATLFDDYDELVSSLNDDNFVLGKIPGGTTECAILSWEVVESAGSPAEEARTLLATYIDATDESYRSNYTKDEWTEITTSVQAKINLLTDELDEAKVNEIVAEAKGILTTIWQNKLKALYDTISEDSYSNDSWTGIVAVYEESQSKIANATVNNCVTEMPTAYQNLAEKIENTATLQVETKRADALEAISNAKNAAIAAINGATETESCNYSLIGDKVTALKAAGVTAVETAVADTTANMKTLNSTVSETVVENMKAAILASISSVQNEYTTQISDVQTFHEVSTEDDLRAVATFVNDTANKNVIYNVKLMNNITLTEETAWTPIGLSTSYPYTGVFLGQGYTISGINDTENSSYDSHGLFGTLSNAEIHNVEVKGNVTTKSYAGGIAGNVLAGSNVIISNCINGINITQNGNSSGNTYTGGIVGYISGATNTTKVVISNCINQGKIENTSTSHTRGIGGILGDAGKYCDVQIISCENEGTLTITGKIAGGIVGQFAGNSSRLLVKDCFNSGTLTTTRTSSGSGYGGIVGYLKVYASIVNCGNEKKIIGYDNVGGIVGYLSTSGSYSEDYEVIQNCFNSATVQGVTGKNTKYIGGIIGYAINTANTVVTDVYNEGSISGYEGLGGLIGAVGLGSSNVDFKVCNGYSTVVPTVTGTKTTYGSVVGTRTYTPATNIITIENCYGPDPVSGTSDLSTGMTASDDMSVETLATALGNAFAVSDGVCDQVLHAQRVYGDVDAQREKALAVLALYVEDDYYPTQWNMITEKVAAYTEQLYAAETAQEVRDLMDGETGVKADLNTIPLKKTIDETLATEKAAVIARVNDFADPSKYQESVQKRLEDSKIIDTAKATLKTDLDEITGEDYSVNYGTDTQNDALEAAETKAKSAISEIILGEGAWDGVTKLEPAVVNGVYQITNGAELAWMADQSGIDAVLCNDIDLGSRLWTPIGTFYQHSDNTSSYFKNGSLDGQNYTIYGLYVDAEQHDSLEGAVEGKHYNYGGLFTQLYNSKIKNLTVYGTVIAAMTDGSYGADTGGIAAAAYSGTVIRNCTSYVNVYCYDSKNGSYGYRGGIVGAVNGATITECKFYGDVDGSRSTAVGGIAGWITGDGSLVNFSSNYGYVHGATYAGGIVGYVRHGAAVRQCYNQGIVYNSCAGGIAGRLGNDGVDAAADSVVSNCYNMGNVSGGTTGGIVGSMVDSLNNTTTGMESNPLVENCYNAFGDEANLLDGGIVGNFKCGTLKNNYVLRGAAEGIYGEINGSFATLTGVNCFVESTKLKDEGHSLLGDAYCMDTNGINNGYPILTWQDAEAELQSAIIDAIAALQKKWLTFSNEQYVYGTEFSKIQDIVNAYSTKLVKAQSEDDIAVIVAEAEEELGAVKGQLELAKESAKAAIKEAYEAKYDNCTEENQAKLDDILNSANTAIDAVKIISGNSDCNTMTKVVSTINVLQNDYLSQIAAILTNEESALKTAINRAIANLNTAYSNLKSQNTYTEDGFAELDAAKEAGIAAIQACTDEASVTAALEQAVAAMQKVQVDTSKWTAEQLRDSLKAQLSAGIEELTASGDYAEEQIETLETISETYQEELDDADLEAEDAKDTLQSIYAEAVTKVAEVPTIAELNAAALEEARATVQEAMEARNEELQTSTALTETDKSRMNDYLDTYVEALALAQDTETIAALYNELDTVLKEIVTKAEDPYSWKGAVDEPTKNEDGYYEIYTAAQLAWLAKGINDGTITGTPNAKLMNDIDLNNQLWTPIGNASNRYYTGTFDGCGYTVKNMYVYQTDTTSYAGLFGNAKKANIENLNVDGAIVAAKASKTGGILGYGDEIALSNCLSSVDIAVTCSGGNGYNANTGTYSYSSGTTLGIGGVAGYLEGTETNITNCTYEGNLTAAPASDTAFANGVGGIVGCFKEGANITACVNRGNIEAERAVCVGGIVGLMEPYVPSASEAAVTTLTECTNKGTVNAAINATSSDSRNIGGIVGYAKVQDSSASNATLSISYVYNAGTVLGETNVGGILGQSEGSKIQMSNVYNKVYINPEKSGTNVGAIVGYADSGNFNATLYSVEGAADRLFGFTPSTGVAAEFVTADVAVSADFVLKLNDGTANFLNVAGMNDGCPVLYYEVTLDDLKTAAILDLQQAVSGFVSDNYFEEQWAELEELANAKVGEINAAETEETLDKVTASFTEMLAEMAEIKTKQQVLSEAVNAATDSLNEKFNEYEENLNKYLASDWVTMQQTYNQAVTDFAAAETPEAVQAALDAALAAMAEVPTVDSDDPDDPDTPDNPEDPDDPDTPDNPDNPDNPDTPDNPDDSDYDQACVQKFYDAYAAIGTTVTENSGEAIENARAVYDALTDAQKALVDPAYVTSLEQAEADYADIQTAAVVAGKIRAIGTVSTASKNAINEAKTAYDALTDSQKNYLKNIGYATVLQDAITTYNDMAAAASVETAIANIGTVTTSSGTLITTARNAYDALTTAQQSYVGAAYKTILTNAETKYAYLVQSDAANATGSYITGGLISGSILGSGTTTSTGLNSALLSSLYANGATTGTGVTSGSLLSSGLTSSGTTTGSSLLSGLTTSGTATTDSTLTESETSTTTTTNQTAATTGLSGVGGQEASVSASAEAGSSNLWKTVAIILAILLLLVLLAGTAVIFYTAGNKRRDRFDDDME